MEKRSFRRSDVWAGRSEPVARAVGGTHRRTASTEEGVPEVADARSCGVVVFCFGLASFATTSFRLQQKHGLRMTDDDHGIDIEEDTELETADDEEQTAEEHDNEANREIEKAEKERSIEQESEVREEEASEQENPDSHRDEDPFQ